MLVRTGVSKRVMTETPQGVLARLSNCLLINGQTASNVLLILLSP